MLALLTLLQVWPIEVKMSTITVIVYLRVMEVHYFIWIVLNQEPRSAEVCTFDLSKISVFFPLL